MKTIPGTIQVVDSHTGGEPTRVVVDGLPDLGAGSLAEQAYCFHSRYADYRRAVVNEPRGSDILVGALLLPAQKPSALCGVIFFNNVGVLGMCGHGTIGLIATLAHLGRVQPGTHCIETPVGDIAVSLDDAGQVSVTNVPSFRWQKALRISVANFGSITGDIAWGGNWFFLVTNHGQDLQLANVEALTQFTWSIRKALDAHGIVALPELNDGVIDHIELFAGAHDARNHSRNFVLCPGKAYDRSPCGTGTSAKLACLAEDGLLQPGEPWRQESITGSVFEASYQRGIGHAILPTIRGVAFMTAECRLLLDPRDPLRFGIAPAC